MRQSRTSQKAMELAEAPVSQPCKPLRQIFCHACGTFSKEPCFQHITRVPDKVVPYAIASLPDTLYFNFPTGTTTEKAVFARETLPSLTLFGPLVGNVQKQMPKPMRYACRYIEDDSLRYFQLGSDETSNWMKFVRFAENSEEQNVCVYEVQKIGGPPLISAVNSYLQNTCWRVVFVTTREILADEELKVGYSLEYARTLGYRGLEYGADTLGKPKRRKLKRSKSPSNTVIPGVSFTFSQPSLIKHSAHRKDHSLPVLEAPLNCLPPDSDSRDILYSDVTESGRMDDFSGVLLTDGTVVVMRTEDVAQLDEVDAYLSNLQTDQDTVETQEKLDFSEIGGGDAEPAQAVAPTDTPNPNSSKAKSKPDRRIQRAGGYAEKIEKLKALLNPDSDQSYYTGHGTVINVLPNFDDPMPMGAIMASSVLPADSVPVKPKRLMRTPGKIPGHKMCLLCRKTQSLYGNHMRDHHPEWVAANWTLQCPNCRKWWQTQKGLNRHIAKVHGATTVASYSATDPTVKQSHMDYISRTGRYVCSCDKCGAIYPTVALLDVHSLHCSSSHPPARLASGSVYTCPAGDFTGTTAAGLNTHLHQHEIPKDSLSPCLMCGISLCPTSLQRHAYLKHPEEMKLITEPWTFSCEQCDKRFPSQTILTGHMVMHRKAGSQCMYCARLFATGALLSVHLEEHKVAGRFPCQYCAKTYETYKQLQTHFRNFHDVTKSRVCRLCGKVCKNYGQLTIHSSTHPPEERGISQYKSQLTKMQRTGRKKRKVVEKE